GCDAAKTGMLGSAPIVEIVAERIAHYEIENLVVDPVMVAKSGDHLLQQEAVEALKTQLLPLAAVVTPNTEEAAILAGMPRIETPEQIKEAARRIRDLGPDAVLIKGGHLSGTECEDFWFDGEEFGVLTGERLNARNTHGTGCTLSAALAAWLASGASPTNAARDAKEFISRAIASAEPLGRGIGPVNHFWLMKE
ncbi:MAG: bifunctional hydroxymethylpyrimidine kinase/phosphomethylpyrimidine kinase, partial [Pseudomonadota bacterium]